MIKHIRNYKKITCKKRIYWKTRNYLKIILEKKRIINFHLRKDKLEKTPL